LKAINSFVLLIFCLGLLSCNSSTPSATSGKSVTQSDLVLNQRTEVYQGQSYEALSSDAIIDVEFDASTGKRFVTLKSGQGTIKKN
jgi:hypothetical protein